MKDENTIEPNASGLPEDHGFKVPEGYFENFEDRLMQNLGERRLPAPGINPFSVPEDYFSSFEDRVISKIHSGKKPVLKLVKKPVWYAAAASVLILAISGSLLYKNWKQQPVIQTPVTLAEVPAEEIRAFAEEVELSDDELLAMVSEQTLDSLNNSYAVAENKVRTTTLEEEAALIQDEFSIEADEEDIDI